jgi:hypothetical protein
MSSDSDRERSEEASASEEKEGELGGEGLGVEGEEGEAKVASEMEGPTKKAKKNFIERTEINAIIKTIVIAIESDDDLPLINLEFNQIRSGLR